jgi:hypothetical protein
MAMAHQQWSQLIAPLECETLAMQINSKPRKLSRSQRTPAMTTPPLRTDDELNREQAITQLLDLRRTELQTHPVYQPKIDRIDRQIVEQLDGYLRLSLLPVMAKMFGPQVFRQNNDSSVRFTVMLNELFVKILRGRADMEKKEDARHLRNWCSTAIRNQMLNHVSQKSNRSTLFQSIAPLYEAQQSHFEKRFGGDTFDRALMILESWATGSDDKKKQFAAILELHYLMGVPWDGVCDALDFGRSKFFEALHEDL